MLGTACRVSQAKHSGATGMVQCSGRCEEADDRDRGWSMGERAFICLQQVWTGVRSLAGTIQSQAVRLPLNPHPAGSPYPG